MLTGAIHSNVKEIFLYEDEPRVIMGCPNQEVSKLGDPPHSFILYGIREDTWNTLANRVIWRTKSLRFAAYKLVDDRPAFLGAIKHLLNYYSDKDSPSL